jgi:geranylgeranyl diphosphate synthase type II
VDSIARIEKALAAAIDCAAGADAPPGLGAAMRHAVFPGGARFRPKLCLAIAAACGDKDPAVADAAAAAIELLHCASLVHDDLPCFDDAPIRRGRPSVHAEFGEALAVLSGDALIVLAFQQLASVAVPAGGRRLAQLLEIVAQGVGSPGGIVAGQALECEPFAALSDYQRAKTAALFAAAAMAGAVAGGADPAPWRAMGLALGEAFQVADDLRDALGSATELGKPVQRDIALDRPNAVMLLGLPQALQRFDTLLADSLARIPPCSGACELEKCIRTAAQRLLPARLALEAA